MRIIVTRGRHVSGVPVGRPWKNRNQGPEPRGNFVEQITQVDDATDGQAIPLKWFSRLASAAVIVWAGVATAEYLTAVELVGPTPPPHQMVETASLGTVPVDLDSAGLWTIGNLPWQLTVRPVTADELEASLNASIDPVSKLRAATEHESALLALVACFSSKTEAVSGGLTVHHVDLDTVRARVFVSAGETDDEQASLAAFRVAVPDGEARWRLISGTPQLEDLLPRPRGLMRWPSGTTQLAARSAHDGRLSCEVVAVVGEPRRILERIWQAGWQVVRSVEVSEETAFVATARAGESLQLIVHYNAAADRTYVVAFDV